MSGEIANALLISCLFFALLWLASKCQSLRERVEHLERLAGVPVRDPTHQIRERSLGSVAYISKDELAALRARIVELETAIWDVLNATVSGGMGTIRLPDTDANRELLGKLGRVLQNPVKN